MNWKRSRGYISSIITNGLAAYLLWLWLGKNVVWAGNVTRFTIPLYTVCAIIAAIALRVDKVVCSKVSEPIPFPLWVHAVYDTACVLALAAFAHYWLAFCWFVQGLAFADFYNQTKALADAKKERES